MRLYYDLDDIITSKLSTLFNHKRLACIVNIVYTHAIHKLSKLLFKIPNDNCLDIDTEHSSNTHSSNTHSSNAEYHVILVTTNQWFDILYSICSMVNEYIYYQYFYDTCTTIRLLHVSDIETMINKAIGKRVMAMDSHEVLINKT
jgi:hypothetical protein